MCEPSVLFECLVRRASKRFRSRLSEIKRKTSRLTTAGSSSSISLKHLRMIPLALAFAICVSHLLVLVTADSNNYFVYPPANPNYSSYAPDVTFGTLQEGASIILQWVTTWDSVHILLSQNNNPFPLPLPNSRMWQNIAELTHYTLDCGADVTFNRKYIRHLVIYMGRGSQWRGR